jgi:ASC-1-like (ASCH) protein
MPSIPFQVQEPYQTYLLSGQKTVEGRLNKGTFATLVVGSQLALPNGAVFTVIRITPYHTFFDMLQSEGIERVIPDATSIETARDVYYKFYTKEQEAEYGVLAIEVQRITA